MKGITVMKQRTLHIFTIAVIGAAIFLPSVTGGFIWDDEFLILYNPIIKSLKNIPSAFTHEFFHNAFETEQITFYRPIVTVLNALQYHTFGLRPLWWRLTNILLHSLNAVLCYLFLTGILKLGRNGAFAGSLFFAVHPALSEPVCFVSGRTDLLALCLILSAALLFYHERTRQNFYGTVALLFFIAGLFTKELVLMLPAALAGVDYIASETTSPKLMLSKRLPALLFRLSPFLLAGIVYMMTRFFLIKGIQIPHYPSGSALTTWLTMPRVFLRYLRLIIAPAGLVCDYTNYFTIETSPFSPRFLTGMGVIVVMLLAMARLLRQRSQYVTGVLWFILFLLPVSNIFPLGLWMAERFLYIPMVGIAIIIAVAADGRMGRFLAVRILFGAVLVIFAGISMARSLTWRDAPTLWSDAVRKNPANPQAHIIFAQVLYSRGRYAESERELMVADTSSSPNLASQKEQTFVKIYLAQKELTRAEEALRRSESVLPRSAFNAVLKGRLKLARGQLFEAEAAFREAAELNPELLSAFEGLMETLAGHGAPAAELLHAAEQAIAINPDFAPSYVYKGMALRKIGKDDEAMGAFKDAIRLSPEAPEAYLFLADMYETRAAKDPGALKNAVAIYQELLMRHPDNIDALNNLAIIYAQKGEKEKARELWTRLLAIRPDDPEAKSNLQRLNGGIK
jgi:tetratricopeptide (TPR) repeat protein